MKIFQLTNHTITFEPEILLIPEFLVLYKRDKSKAKETAFSEFEYIFFVCDWNSPYRVYSNLEERKDKVKQDYIKDLKWKEGTEIKAAMQKYSELTKTPSMGLLEDAYHLIDVLRRKFRSATIENTNPKDAMTALEKLDKVVASMKKLEETVAKEKIDKTSNRGGRDASYDEV